MVRLIRKLCPPIDYNLFKTKNQPQIRSINFKSNNFFTVVYKQLRSFNIVKISQNKNIKIDRVQLRYLNSSVPTTTDLIRIYFRCRI